MNPYANSLILTGMLYILDVIFNGNKYFTKYFIIFLLFLGIGFTFKANADVSLHNIEYLISPNEKDYVDPKLPVWRKFLLHLQFARENYKEAEDFVWWNISDKYDDKEKAKLCFESALVGIVPPNPLGKAIGITLLLFKEYGLDCIDRYNYVNRLLHKAQYHVEMYEFYNELEDGEMDDLCCKGYVVIHTHKEEEQD